MAKRAKYQWGAKDYLAGFRAGECREYDESVEHFPWRSLASIAARMGLYFGMKFSFKTDRQTGRRTITREF